MNGEVRAIREVLFIDRFLGYFGGSSRRAADGSAAIDR
jgi:hypothetical protein